MIYKCAECNREIEALRTPGEKVNKDFFCKECAFKRHDAYVQTQGKMIEYLVKEA